MKHGFVYLASQSPRRQQLLAQIGARFELLLPDADEDAEALEATRAGEAPLLYVQRVTRAKLAAARQRLQRRGLPPAPVLCADTTVARGRAILGTPADAAEAEAMLQRLSGRPHRVYTAVAVHDGRRIHAGISDSRVRVAALPPAVRQAYVASGEPMGKAGAYAIQGAAAALITRVEGSLTNVIGLPLDEVLAAIRACVVPT